MFERLTEKLEQVFKRLRGRGKITPEQVESALREIRLAFLEADVNYKVTRELEQKIRVRAVGQEVAESLTPAQQVIKIVRDELTEILGGRGTPLSYGSGPVAALMLVGLHGSGKTTSAAKIAHRAQQEGRRPLLVAADTYRPAAQDQLRVLGLRIGVPVLETPGAAPADLARRGLASAAAEGRDLVIIDTAGRFHIDRELMGELKEIRDAVLPAEVLMVADAMTGQEAVNVAAGFHREVGLTGVILTKVDGDARGGAALSIKSALGVPLKFLGVGEGLEQLEPFHPDRLAARILGMGDVLSLIERAERTLDRKQADELARKIRRREFDLEDFRRQLGQVRRLGPLKQTLGMLPGAGRLKLDQLQVDEKELLRVDAIIGSMTPEERRRPTLIGGSRRRRIARGSGTSLEDVNRLLKKFSRAQRMMKQMTKAARGSRSGGMPQGLEPWG